MSKTRFRGSDRQLKSVRDSERSEDRRSLKNPVYRLLKKTQRRGARKIDPSAGSGQAKRRRTSVVR